MRLTHNLNGGKLCGSDVRMPQLATDVWNLPILSKSIRVRVPIFRATSRWSQFGSGPYCLSKLSSSFGVQRLLISVGFLFLRIFLNLVRSLFVLLTDFVEPLHVLKEVGAALKSDEKLGFLAVIPVVRGGLHVNCLGSNRSKRGVIVPKITKSEFMIVRVRSASPASCETTG